MNYRNIAHSAEGLNTVLGRGKASLNSLLVAENIRVNSGEMKIREGQEYLDTFDIADDIRAVYELSRIYYDLTDTQQTYREYVFSSGVNLYGWPEGAAVADLLNAAYPLTGATPYNIWAAEYMDWMYIVNGFGKMYKYDAIDFFLGYIEAPAAAPVVAVTGAAVGMTDGYRAYKYRYIYSVVDGSNNRIDYVASPFSAIGNSPLITGLVNSPVVTLVASADAQMTPQPLGDGYIELYCTKEFATVAELTGATFYRTDYTAAPPYYHGLNNTNQNYPDTLLDANIDAFPFQHPEEDTTTSWTNPPEGLDLLTYHKDRLYAAAKGDPSAPRYSELGVPESWPTDNWLDCRRDDGDKVTGFCSSGNDLYIFKERSVWILTGDPDAAAVLQVKTGGERTGAQTEFGLGCTAPRSLATYGDDAVIFYSKIYGVYMISEGRLFNLTKNTTGYLNLPATTSGAVYTDADGDAFYVLSPPTGKAWVFHLESKAIVNDTNVNVYCFCVDHDGRLIGRSGKSLNHFYDPDSTDDNGTEIQAEAQTAFVNLRDGEFEALLRGVQVQSNGIDAVNMTVYTEEGERYNSVFNSLRQRIGLPGIRGRLFSIALRWTVGVIESLTLLYLRRRSH